jgi:PPE-repeat protein
MDFGVYPPEINSGRMYTGPGSGPMLAAAQAWDALADELYTAAGSYQSVVSGVTEGAWTGPSSASMAAAADSYVTWLTASAAQAEQTAAQARAAAAAYQTAFAMTVPPPVIAANRALLLALVATNFFGQNTPAIAATEAQYAEMWAQDAAAMYGYAGSSASASTLTPFNAPGQNTTPGASAGQAAAVGQATGTSAGDVQSTVSGVSQALSAAAAPAQTDPLTTLSNLISIFVSAPADVTILATVPVVVLGGIVDLPFAYVGTVAGVNTDDTFSGWAGVEAWPGTATVAPTEFPAVITNPGPLAGYAPTMSAGVGEAGRIGALSVPQAWTVEAPTVRNTARTLPMSPATGATPAAAAAAAETAEAGSGRMLSQLGLAGMLGSSMGGNGGAGDDNVDAKAPNRRVAPRAAAGKDEATQDNPRIVVTGVAARIRQLAQLRNQGRLTEEEFTEHKNRLLGR